MNIKICMLLLWAAMANGLVAETTEQEGLTLKEAVIRVLENHPKLQVADYEAQAMAARMREALLRPADKLNINLEDFAGTGEAQDVKGMEATLSLTRTLELGDKARYRGGIIEHRAQLLQNQRDIDRLDLLAETARRFVHVAADQERLQATRDAIELIHLTEKTLERSIRLGKTPTAERQRIFIDLANYELELDHRRHEMETSRVQLSTMWNQRQPDFDTVSANLFHLEPLPEFEKLVAFLDQNPDLLRYTRSEALARARLRLEQSFSKPDLQLSAGLRYLGAGDDAALMFSASIPLGTEKRAQHSIDEALALSQIDPLNAQQKSMELYAMLFAAYQELQHAMDAVLTLRKKIIPATEKMLDAYEKGFQAGRYSLPELIRLQEQLRDARARAVEMAASYHEYRIEIDRLTAAQLN